MTFDLETATDVLDSIRPLTIGDLKKGFKLHLEATHRRERLQAEPLKAGLDCGRWVVNCKCGSGIALHPQWQFAGCFLCGRSWDKVEFPSDEFLAKVIKVLACRPAGSIRQNPKRFWSWWPNETIDDLIAENVRHRWPVPEGI